MKKGKEIKLNSRKNYNISFGSVNNKEPKTAYLNITGWAEPISEDLFDYNKIIRDFNKKIKQHLYQEFSNQLSEHFFDDKIIVDFDIKESGIKFGKRSFMSCEITLYSNNELPVNDDYMKNMMHNIYSHIIKNVFESNEIFDFYKKKK
jgi:hypothetical protein